MPLIIIFFIWYGMYGRNNPNVYSKIHNKIGWIIALFVIFGGLSGFSSLFGGLLAVSIVIAFFWSSNLACRMADCQILQGEGKAETK